MYYYLIYFILQTVLFCIKDFLKDFYILGALLLFWIWMQFYTKIILKESIPLCPMSPLLALSIIFLVLQITSILIVNYTIVNISIPLFLVLNFGSFFCLYDSNDSGTSGTQTYMDSYQV